MVMVRVMVRVRVRVRIRARVRVRVRVRVRFRVRVRVIWLGHRVRAGLGSWRSVVVTGFRVRLRLRE